MSFDEEKLGRKYLTEKYPFLEDILHKVSGTDIFGIETELKMSNVMHYPINSYAQGSGESYFYTFSAVKNNELIPLEGELYSKPTISQALKKQNLDPDYLVQEDYLERDGIGYNDAGYREKLTDVTIKIYSKR